MPRSLQESKRANLDLNLLVSLDALLAERSVSRAAERLDRDPGHRWLRQLFTEAARSPFGVL